MSMCFVSLVYVDAEESTAGSDKKGMGVLWSGSLDQSIGVWSCNARYNVVAKANAAKAR